MIFIIKKMYLFTLGIDWDDWSEILMSLRECFTVVECLLDVFVESEWRSVVMVDGIYQ